MPAPPEHRRASLSLWSSCVRSSVFILLMFSMTPCFPQWCCGSVWHLLFFSTWPFVGLSIEEMRKYASFLIRRDKLANISQSPCIFVFGHCSLSVFSVSGQSSKSRLSQNMFIRLRRPSTSTLRKTLLVSYMISVLCFPRDAGRHLLEFKANVQRCRVTGFFLCGTKAAGGEADTYNVQMFTA